MMDWGQILIHVFFMVEFWGPYSICQGMDKFVLVAHRTGIRQIAIDYPHEMRVVIQLDRAEMAISVDYDASTGFVYWTDIHNGMIRRIPLNGTESEIIVDQLETPDDVAVDWIAQNVYWTDGKTNRIEVAKAMNGSSKKILISENLDKPRAICLDPAAGYMYWTDWGTHPYIERAFLDGTGREKIVDTDLGWPNGLAVDLEERLLYWGDARTDRIEVVDLDGGNRRVLVDEGTRHVFGLSLLGDFLYWTDWMTKSVERALKDTGLNRSSIGPEFTTVMGIKAVDVDEEMNTTNTCGENNGKCSHLCLYRPSPYKRVCACPSGMELLSDGVTCYQTKGYLFFTNRASVQKMMLEIHQTQSSIVLPGAQEIVAVDLDIQNGRLYWADGKLGQINRIFINGSQPETIAQTVRDVPSAIAVDWIAGNIYWIGKESHWIEVARLDGSSRKVLVWRDLAQPSGLTLDPANGYMYWASVLGNQSVIERAQMDGENREIIVETTGRIQDMIIDYDQRRLYWTEVDGPSLQSSDMNGTDIRLLVKSPFNQPTNLALYEDFIYWTDLKHGSLERAYKTDGTNRFLIQDNMDFLMDVVILHDSRQFGSNACDSKNNGGCSHLCFAYPAILNSSHHCGCPSHYHLNEDNLTCSGMDKFILLAHGAGISQLSLDLPQELRIDLQFDQIGPVTAVDYDLTTGFVYWSDSDQESIRRAQLNDRDSEIIADKVETSDGVAVDWISQNVYWTDSRANLIEVARVTKGLFRKVLISENLDEPRAICLDPAAGYMYWTDWGGKPYIERAFLDGTGREKIVDTDLGWPNGLAVDLEERRLYWGDARTDRIEIVDLDGGNRRVLVADVSSHIFGLSLLDDFIYWTDWTSRAIERANKDTGLNRSSIHSDFFIRNIMGLKVVDVNQTKEMNTTNSCAENNGNCSHLCLYRPSPYKRVCACPSGMEVYSNGNTCYQIKGYVLVANKISVLKFSLETLQSYPPIVLPGAQKIIAMDLDIKNERLYWLDGRQKIINRIFINGSQPETIAQTVRDVPSAIAVDWIAGNFYWIGKESHWIEVARLNGSSRKVLVWRDLAQPSGLTLDPANGYMYWASVVGNQSVIERAHMDGENREIIVETTGRINEMIIDYDQRRLYWTEFDGPSIQSSDMNGTDIRLLVKSRLNHPTGIGLYGDFIYWIDFKRLERANKTNGSNRSLIQDKQDALMNLAILHDSRQSGNNACGSNNNGGCSHLCFANPVTKNSSHHCGCPSHYHLNEDNLSCSEPSEYLVATTRGTPMRLVFYSNSPVDTPEVVLPIHTMLNIKAITYDPVDKFIYWIQGRHRTIKRVGINGSMTDNVVQAPRHYFKPYDIDFDPFSRTLYWTDASLNSINVTRIVTSSPNHMGAIIIDVPRFKPRSIVLYPEKGKLFVTNIRAEPRIEVALMDGSERKVLISDSSWFPQSLTIDKKGQKLYWADSSLNKIEMADLDGQNRKVLIDHLSNSPRNVVVYGNFLYWLTKGDLERVDKKTGDDRLVVRDQNLGLKNLIAVDHIASSALSQHPCYINNGGCSHLCYTTEDLSAKCSCPSEGKLRFDQRSCARSRSCGNNYFTCRSGRVQCIPLSWRCDFQTECEDGSDEEDCQRCDNDEFECGNGYCVHQTLTCNGNKDCSDGTDELDCRVEDDDCCESSSIVTNCTSMECRDVNVTAIPDMSHEMNQSRCNDEQFRCQNDTCIERRFLCNGIDDCRDGSDESDCDIDTRDCCDAMDLNCTGNCRIINGTRFYLQVLYSSTTYPLLQSDKPGLLLIFHGLEAHDWRDVINGFCPFHRP